jgi:hypothetical protein
MPERLQDLLSRHRAAAWKAQTRGQSCCAQLHEEFARELERLQSPAMSRSEMHDRMVARDEAEMRARADRAKAALRREEAEEAIRALGDADA